MESMRLLANRHRLIVCRGFRLDLRASWQRLVVEVARSIFGEVGVRNVFLVRMPHIQASTQRRNMLVCFLDLRVHLHEFVHRMRGELVGQHDGGFRACLVDDLAVIPVNRGHRVTSIGLDVPVVRVLLPKDCAHAECRSNVAHTVIHVALRGPPAQRRHTNDFLDHLPSIVKLSKHLLVRERSHQPMRPGVMADIMPVHKTPLSLVGVVEHIGTNIEQSRTDLLTLQKVVKLVVRTVRSVVKRKTPGTLFLALCNVWEDVGVLGLVTSRPRPPTVGVRRWVVVRPKACVIRRCLAHINVGNAVLDLVVQCSGFLVIVKDTSNLIGRGEFVLLFHLCHPLVFIIGTLLFSAFYLCEIGCVGWSCPSGYHDPVVVMRKPQDRGGCAGCKN